MANNSYIEGLSDVYGLTAKIAELQKNADKTQTSASQTLDPDQFILNMQKNFNSMLNNLMFSSNDDNKETSTDPFAGYFNSTNYGQAITDPNQNSNLALNLLKMQQLDISNI